MKPLHVGMLVVGAALAGGLAVRMSQPQALQVSSALTLPSAPVSSALIASAPSSVASALPHAVQVAASTPAPPPVYMEPGPAPAPQSRRKPFMVAPVPAFTPAAKTAPVSFAAVSPMSIHPAPYQNPPSLPVQTQTVAPEPVPEPVQEPDKAQPVPEPRRVTLHQGMQISVRLDQSLSTEHVLSGDSFQASLAQPLTADGLIIAERGARIAGRVVNSRRAGLLTGTPELELALSSVRTSDGQNVAIPTEPWVQSGTRGGALGAMIGAIAGGGTDSPDGGRTLNIPNDTVIHFRLATRVTVTERPF